MMIMSKISNRWFRLPKLGKAWMLQQVYLNHSRDLGQQISKVKQTLSKTLKSNFRKSSKSIIQHHRECTTSTDWASFDWSKSCNRRLLWRQLLNKRVREALLKSFMSESLDMLQMVLCLHQKSEPQKLWAIQRKLTVRVVLALRNRLD